MSHEAAGTLTDAQAERVGRLLRSYHRPLRVEFAYGSARGAHLVPDGWVGVCVVCGDSTYRVLLDPDGRNDFSDGAFAVAWRATYERLYACQERLEGEFACLQWLLQELLQERRSRAWRGE